jgi:hypothetical protein
MVGITRSKVISFFFKTIIFFSQMWFPTQLECRSFSGTKKVLHHFQLNVDPWGIIKKGDITSSVQ